MDELVFEIGTEELPSSCIKEGIKELGKILSQDLRQSRINYSQIKTFGTPRRLVAIVDEVAEMQESEKKVVTGPPKKIAYKDGKPTKAAIGFAKSLGLKPGELEEIKTGNGIYMGKTILEEGKPTIEVIPGILKDTMLSISFSKRMRWGDLDITFARPIRWILALLGDRVIEFDVANLTPERITYGYRALAENSIKIASATEYVKKLREKGKVILDPEERKNLITSSIENIEQVEWGGKLKTVLNESLLEEVANLVEIPNVLVGSFPEQFLYIPKDILIKAIEYHQKYFAVLDKSGNVSTKFIIVQNGVEDISGEIAKGNSRVLWARLSDAAFFYEEDKKHSFPYWLEKLKGVIFYSGIGNMHDKVQRITEISLNMAALLEKSYMDGDLKKAAEICKCDLVTNMVVEFPELQGIVGREYALEKDIKEDIANSVFEHYKPNFAGDSLPSTKLSAVLSIADKIDTISGMFLLGNIPTGSEDPFALRRKASGIVKTMLDKEFDLNISDLASFSLDLYAEKFKVNKGENIEGKVVDFVLARYRYILEKRKKQPDIFDAITATGASSVYDISLRYKAVEDFINKGDIESIINPMVRCKNITRGREAGEVDPSLFAGGGEKRLFETYRVTEEKVKAQAENKEYAKMLLSLQDFGKVIDDFFDEVLVMAKGENIRRNRINLVNKASSLYYRIADFSKLVI
ncbi:MAG: glycine--tRNA ligase subunit beta [Candidatus Humimicrobiaceae bacterium]